MAAMRSRGLIEEDFMNGYAGKSSPADGGSISGLSHSAGAAQAAAERAGNKGLTAEPAVDGLIAARDHYVAEIEKKIDEMNRARAKETSEWMNTCCPSGKWKGRIKIYYAGLFYAGGFFEGYVECDGSPGVGAYVSGVVGGTGFGWTASGADARITVSGATRRSLITEGGVIVELNAGVAFIGTGASGTLNGGEYNFDDSFDGAITPPYPSLGGGADWSRKLWKAGVGGSLMSYEIREVHRDPQ